MAGYVNLPQYQIPENALINFQPVNNALANYGQVQRGIEQTQYDRKRQAVADARAAAAEGRAATAFKQQQQDRLEDRIGSRVVEASKLPADDPRRARVLNWALSQHPGAANLPPEYHDPAKGLDLIAADYGKFRNTNAEAMQALELEKTRAEINKLNAQAANGGAESYGKSGTIVQDRDGTFYSVQFGAKGEKKVEPLQLNGTALAPSRGTDVVGDTVIDKATGREVRNIGVNIAAGEEAKKTGANIAEGKASWPTVTYAYKNFNNVVDRNNAIIDRAISKIGPNTTGWGAVLASLPQSEANELKNDLDTIRANVGFSELQNMRDASKTGGALGNVSEMENRLLQAVQGSVDQIQRGQRIKENLLIIKNNMEEIRKLKAAQYRDEYGRLFGAEPSQGGGLLMGRQGQESFLQDSRAVPGLPDGWSVEKH